MGYGFCHPLSSDGAGGGKRAVLGSPGARDERGARSTVLAVARAAASGGADTVYVALLASHPALAELLEAGFKVGDADTFMASSPRLLDGRPYAPSSDLG